MLDWLLNILFPPRCPVCGKYIESRNSWCPGCLARLSAPHRLPLDKEMSQNFDMGIWALGEYEGSLRDIIRNLKYEKQLSLLLGIHDFVSLGLGKLQEQLGEYFADAVVVPVPLHPKKLKSRGFNQAEVIFREPFVAMGLEMYLGLHRTKDTRPQYGLKAEERRQNMQDVFSLVEPERLANKNIILVDDIMTTGATLQSCGLALRQAGIKGLMALTAASGRK